MRFQIFVYGAMDSSRERYAQEAQSLDVDIAKDYGFAVLLTLEAFILGQEIRKMLREAVGFASAKGEVRNSKQGHRRDLKIRKTERFLIVHLDFGKHPVQSPQA